jgi:hypothetical protein
MPASAAAPFIWVEDISESHIDECEDFDVIHSTEGQIRFFDFSPTRFQDVVHLTESWTNATTGKTLRSPNVGPDKVQVMEDGSEVVAVIGLLNRIVVPGVGLVEHESGRIVLRYEGPDDQEPDVLFVGGPHGDGPFPELCVYLAE